MSKHEIAHGAYIDTETNQVNLPVGNVTLNLSFEEWNQFCEMIDDINTVIQMNTVENMAQCPACHTVVSYVHYEEPSDDEIN